MLELGSFCIHNNKLCEYCARLKYIYYLESVVSVEKSLHPVTI